MNWLLRLWAWLLAWLGFSKPEQKSAPVYRTSLVQERLPRELEPGILYIVEDDDFLEQAAMVCPCGCGSTLHMNLLPDERPCWRVEQHANGAVSLFPSVWRQVGCRSHFWFREGRIHWCQ